MTTVYWCPALNTYHNTTPHDSAELFFQQPDSLFKAIASEYAGAEFLECYAVQDFCKNTYVVRAPFDITYTFDKATGVLSIDRLGQTFFNSFCAARTDGSIETAPAYLFYAKESVKIETLPMFLLKSPVADAVHYIPGQFDIGRWIRPIVWSFFLKNPDAPLVVRRGEPLFLVRFTPADGSKVEFERVEHDSKLVKVVNACTSAKHYVPKIPLRKLYDMADGYIKHFLKGTK